MRTEATKIRSKIETELHTLSLDEKTRLKTRIEKLLSNLESMNEQIFKCLFQDEASDDETQAEYDSCVEYDGVLQTSLDKMRRAVPPVDPPVNDGGNARTALKLPHVPLPEYGHNENENLQIFLINFGNVIAKY